MTKDLGTSRGMYPHGTRKANSTVVLLIPHSRLLYRPSTLGNRPRGNDQMSDVGIDRSLNDLFNIGNVTIRPTIDTLQVPFIQ